MARLRPPRTPSGHRIAVIEDYVSLLRNTIRILEADGHEVRGASTAEEGVALVRSFRPELLLLDYHLDGGRTAYDVVAALRGFDPLLQVLLVTGYASDLPPRRLMEDLDLWGYHDKAAGPEELRLKVIAALRHRAALERLARSRRALARILELTAEIGSEADPEAMLERGAAALAELLGAREAIVGVLNRGLFLEAEARVEFRLLGGKGDWAGLAAPGALPVPARNALLAGLKLERPAQLAGGYVAVPLRAADGSAGCILVSAPALPAELVEPFELLGRHLVASLEKAVLLHRATVDGVTGLPNPSESRRRLESLVRLGQRRATPTAALLVRCEGIAEATVEGGAVASELLLHEVGRAVAGACRASDVVGRWEGEAFLIGLPDASVTAGMTVARHVRRAVEALRCEVDGRVLSCAVVVGVASAEPGEVDVDDLVARAAACARRAAETGQGAVGEGRDSLDRVS